MSSTAASRGPLVGASNDIHNELNYGNVNSFENSNIDYVNLRNSNDVMPLQYHTNEYQVSHSGLSEVANDGLYPKDVSSSLLMETNSGTNSKNLNGFIGMYSLLILNFLWVIVSIITAVPPPVKENTYYQFCV